MGFTFHGVTIGATSTIRTPSLSAAVAAEAVAVTVAVATYYQFNLFVFVVDCHRKTIFSDSPVLFNFKLRSCCQSMFRYSLITCNLHEDLLVFN